FPDLYRGVHRFMVEEMIIVIAGKVESRNNSLQWLLSDIKPFTEKLLLGHQDTPERRLFIRYPKESHSINMPIIKEIANTYPGHTSIIVYHEEVRETYRLNQAYDVSLDERCLAALRERFGESNVVFDDWRT